ncbi:MAG: MarR family transcriptional regulator [Candidatus Rokubacteria bacterium]|nr:MarR family transcriptional regulator [Candidatus Rokubacteria bacterium]
MAPRKPPSPWTAEAQQLLDLLNALGTSTFRQVVWQTASELDLTYAQSQVLFYVSEHPGCHMGDVAKAFGVTLPAVTHIIDRLEQKRFAVRGDDPADRRVYLLELTPEGAALVEQLHGQQLKSLEVVLARMSVADRQRVLKGLEALVEASTPAAPLHPKPARRGNGTTHA